MIKQIVRHLRKNQTQAETVFWNVVRNRKLLGKKFSRQYPIEYTEPKGSRTAIAGFYCNECRLIVEIDGTIHDDTVAQDREKDKWLMENGCQIIHFTNDEIENNLDDVIRRLSILVSAISPSSAPSLCERGGKGVS
ncbi:MAG: endonuclease domain-containing protein [Fibrobacterota bacterium]